MKSLKKLSNRSYCKLLSKNIIKIRRLTQKEIQRKVPLLKEILNKKDRANTIPNK